MLTPTMKIRRTHIEELYTKQYDAWAASGQQVIWEE